MNKNEIEQLCKKTPDDRYMSFINNVRHTDSLYVLYNKSKREIALNIAKMLGNIYIYFQMNIRGLYS